MPREKTYINGPGKVQEIREDLRLRFDALTGTPSPDIETLRDLHARLGEYHTALENRERSAPRTETASPVTCDSLADSETRLDIIFEAAEDVAFIIAETDQERRILEFSAGARNLFEYERSEIIGLSLDILCDTEFGACPIGERDNARLRMSRKSGATFPALYSVHPLAAHGEQATAALFIIFDISQREMAERMVRESYDRYMALTMASPISIVTFNAKGIVDFVNEWHMKVLDEGKTQPEFYIGRRINELPGIPQAGVGSRILKVLEGKRVSLEDVYIPAFGRHSEAWNNFRLSPLSQNGEVIGGILIREDVTRRKQIEIDLKLLIDNSPIPLLSVELVEGQHIIRSLNPAAVSMFGPSALNECVDEFVSVLEEDEDTLKGMASDRCEVRTVDGLRQAIRTTHQSSGQFEVQAVQDVSELIKAKELAEEVSRAKSDFMANISHEIRTPLNVLITMLKLFREEDLHGDGVEMIEHAMDAAQTLLALLNDILDFSVIEAGTLALDQQDFNLAEIVSLVVKPYQVEAESKGIALTYEIDEKIPERLWGDGRRIRQILFHLTGNAVKFTDEGTIHILANWTPLEKADGQQGIMEISVSDTGIGMDAAQLKQSFEPFRQVDGARSRRHGGIGIGLSLVQEFLTAMGGELFVDTTPGKGTTIRFTVMSGIPDGRFPYSE